MDTKHFIGLFPGQGSQKVGMGANFLTTDIAKEYFALADKTLGYSLSKLCLEGPQETLTLTSNTQPAILTVSTIAFEVTRSLIPGFTLSAAAGHSLGEYSALVAARAITFEDAVLLVHKRGSYMQEAVPAGKGKMVAVLGKEVEEIEAAIAKSTGVVEVANINSPGQIVVAGSAEGVSSFVSVLGGKTVELPVSAPFHCSLMKSAEEKLTKDLAAISFKDAEFPVYANFDAQAVTTADEIRNALKLQVCGRVRWVECMQNAFKNHGPADAVEFGEGNILSGLLKRIDGSIKRINVSGPVSSL